MCLWSCSILDGLLAQLEGEEGGELLVATLCLLEASAAGLLESELRSLLADESVLRPPSPYEEKGQSAKRRTLDSCTTSGAAYIFTENDFAVMT